MDYITKKISENIYTIISVLIAIGVIYGKFLVMQDTLLDLSSKVTCLEAKCNEYNIEINKISIETKYMVQNTNEIKDNLRKHLEK
jgi:hypothetical protein